MIPLLNTKVEHRWGFFRAGGFDQVKLDSGADIAALDKLDQKLWAALSCPTRGLEFDEKTMDLLDTDKDGRIRAPEIIAAAKWATSMLKDPGVLLDPASPLELGQINDATPEGRQLLASARQILVNLGKQDQSVITLAETTDTAMIFAQTRFNGDGIVPPDSAGDEALRQIIADILTCMGGETDRSGKQGISQARLDLFFEAAEAFANWRGLLAKDPATMPLGEATPKAWGSYSRVKAKIDDYFARTRLTAFDPRAGAAMNRQETEYLAIAGRELTLAAGEVAGLPLARVEAGRALPLTAGLNPAWEAAIWQFAADVVTPMLGQQESLTEAQWATIQSRFSAHAAWLSVKAGSLAEPLGEARVRQILDANARGAVADLIAQDKALEPEASAIAMVDKLVRFKRDLYRLLINYVNLKDFYSPQETAVFQAGVLYLDQRSCELCVRVDDMAKHGTLAPLSRAYLAYCECTRKGVAAVEKMMIAAAFTAGDSDNLMVGRNGVFYDRKGQDWDATIVKIVDNPISIAQAFWSPYKRLIRAIEEQITKRATAADAAATASLTDASGAVMAAKPGEPPKPKPKIDIGTVAALGVGVGAITAALGALLQAFFGLGMLMPLGLIGLVLAISGPAMVIAWLKLRQRNLGPMLDASGWAVNTRAKINLPFGRLLTKRAALPAGAQRDLFDPYAESKAGRYWTIVAVAVLGVSWGVWYFGVAERLCPGVFPKSGFVERREAIKKAAEEKVEKERKAAEEKVEKERKDAEAKQEKERADSAAKEALDKAAKEALLKATTQRVEAAP